MPLDSRDEEGAVSGEEEQSNIEEGITAGVRSELPATLIVIFIGVCYSHRNVRSLAYYS